MLIANMLGVTGAAGLTLALCRRARAIFWAAVGATCMTVMKRGKSTKTMEVMGNDEDQILQRDCSHVILIAPVTKAQDQPYRFFREFVGLNEDQIGDPLGKAMPRLLSLALLTKCSSLARYT